MNAIDLFNSWVKIGKDDGMESNHTNSVKYMLDLIPTKILSKHFSFLDLGCGNGWVVRQVKKIPNCNLSIGIDGSENMITKAILKDKDSNYFQLDINHMEFNTKVDIVFSMEVLYYLSDPKKTLKYIIDNMLNRGGILVFGIDHYKENIQSLSWPQDLNVKMHTLSMDAWTNILHELGLSNIKVTQFGSNTKWGGTLVIYAENN